MRYKNKFFFFFFNSYLVSFVYVLLLCPRPFVSRIIKEINSVYILRVIPETRWCIYLRKWGFFVVVLLGFMFTPRASAIPNIANGIRKTNNRFRINENLFQLIITEVYELERVPVLM